MEPIPMAYSILLSLNQSFIARISSQMSNKYLYEVMCLLAHKSTNIHMLQFNYCVCKKIEAWQEFLQI